MPPRGDPAHPRATAQRRGHRQRVRRCGGTDSRTVPPARVLPPRRARRELQGRRGHRGGDRRRRTAPPRLNLQRRAIQLRAGRPRKRLPARLHARLRRPHARRSDRYGLGGPTSRGSSRNSRAAFSPRKRHTSPGRKTTSATRRASASIPHRADASLPPSAPAADTQQAPTHGMRRRPIPLRDSALGLPRMRASPAVLARRSLRTRSDRVDRRPAHAPASDCESAGVVVRHDCQTSLRA
jgi:hypothetical protein